LFDEIEKAHPDVFNTLLQVLDDGRLTDNKGVTVDFKNTIIILTSNIGSQNIINISDKNERNEQVQRDLKAHFRPEFLNRLDDIVIFDQLDMKAIISIVDVMFKDIQEKLSQRDITITLTQRAKEEIAKEGFDPIYGARPLKRALYEIVEDRLADMILEDRLQNGDSVEFGYDEGSGEFVVK